MLHWISPENSILTESFVAGLSSLSSSSSSESTCFDTQITLSVGDLQLSPKKSWFATIS